MVTVSMLMDEIKPPLWRSSQRRGGSIRCVRDIQTRDGRQMLLALCGRSSSTISDIAAHAEGGWGGVGQVDHHRDSSELATGDTSRTPSHEFESV